MKRTLIMIATLVGLAAAAPAFAGGSSDPHGGDTYNTAGAIAGASATGGAGGAGGSVTNKVDTNILNTLINAPSYSLHNDQHQSEAQYQSEQQKQRQQQNNDQQIAPQQSVKFEAPLIPGTAYAPALTAAGTGVCLGSVSMGVSAPMAGLSFGTTKVDKGCEQRSASALLWQFGYHDAAVRLLMKNDDVREAMGAEGKRLADSISEPKAQPTTTTWHDNREPMRPATDLEEKLSRIQMM